MDPALAANLHVFLAVADAGSVAAASRVLSMDPSTVSRRVSRLEETLGVALFQRSAAGMQLSDPGARLCARVRASQDALVLGLDELRQVPDALSGVVRVTAPTEIGTAFLMPVLAAFRETHPAVEVHFELGARTVDLGRREADLAVRTHRPTHGDIVTRRLPGARMVGCHAASLDPEEAKLRWGAWFESDPLVEGIVAGIDGARIVFRTNDLAGMRSACVHGMASVMLPEPLVPLLGLARLDAVVVDGPPMWLAAPAPSLELPRVRALWDTIAGLWDDAF